MTTPHATEAFLTAYNQIEHRLRKTCKMGSAVPFRIVLRQAIQRDPTLAPVVDQLDLFSQLRNVIVHNGTDLAEPVKATLTAIETIRQRIDAPPRLTPTFLRRTITCSPDDPIKLVAQRMASDDLSQLPVYSRRGLLIGMITSAAIARWLGSHDNEPAQLSTAVSEVMQHEEYPKAFLVLRSDETVGKALASFTHRTDRGEPLYGIVLTPDGRHSSPPNGMITLSDVPRLWSVALE